MAPPGEAGQLSLAGQSKHRRYVVATLAAAASFAASACGGADSPAPRADRGAGRAEHTGLPADAQHVHGLVHRAGVLYIATHAGLWRLGVGSSAVPQAVGRDRHDLMGFSASDAAFVASGHPDPARTDLPPNLGFLRSDDLGRTWESVSLLGEADLHVLAAAGRHVYGAQGSTLLASTDGGRSWTARKAPAAIFSLAISPESARSLVASTEAGLITSVDAGKRFRAVQGGDRLAGLLAWESSSRLYLVDGPGQVRVSRDAGGTWRVTGSLPGQPTAITAARGESLFVALDDGTVRSSRDEGRSWQLVTELR